MAIEAVVFDIGNVLIEWVPERYFDRTIGPERRRALFEAVDLHAMNNDIDRGADHVARVAEEAARHPDWAEEIAVWGARWLDLAGPPIAPSLALAGAVRARGVPLFALSNFGIDTFAMAEAKWPFLKEFDRRYISGHLGMVKPDPAIYAAVEADCGIAPGALLFIDDREENIAAAAVRGWRTHLFDGAEGLERRLAEEGLLAREEGP